MQHSLIKVIVPYVSDLKQVKNILYEGIFDIRYSKYTLFKAFVIQGLGVHGNAPDLILLRQKAARSGSFMRRIIIERF